MAQIVMTRPTDAGGLKEPYMEPEVMAPAAPKLTWGTPYIGFQIGCGWIDGDEIQSENGPCDALGGVHIGYSFPHQGSFVWGVEADYNITDHNFIGVGTGGNSMESDWDASLRLRLGMLVDERHMIYGTGGLAFAGAEMAGAGSATHTGWTLGLGVERDMSEHWLGRIEVRHSDFGAETYMSPTGPVDVEFGKTTVTVGLSYKF